MICWESLFQVFLFLSGETLVSAHRAKALNLNVLDRVGSALHAESGGVARIRYASSLSSRASFAVAKNRCRGVSVRQMAGCAFS